MIFENFTKQALRTESVIDNAAINLPAFKSLLDIFITTGTLLDYFKKGIFYKNYSKYDENYITLVNQLNDNVLEFIESNTNHERVDVDNLNFRLVHGLLGCITESSEVAEHLLKYLEDGTIDRVGISEEAIGDIGWYQAILVDELKIDHTQALTNVINKLKVRFPEKYSDDLAANRNTGKEREKLEEKI